MDRDKKKTEQNSVWPRANGLCEQLHGGDLEMVKVKTAASPGAFCA